MTSGDFATSRSQFGDTGQPTADVAALGDEAFSSTIGAGSVETNTIEALHGGTDLLITAGAPLPSFEALARQVLESLGA